MKYYTKDWYSLMQRAGQAEDFRKIADKQYSYDEIKAFYDKQLKQEIRRAKRAYSTPPENYAEQISEEGFDPEAWMLWDAEKDEPHYPETAEEARAMWQEKYQRELELFENRPPFNLAEVRSDFEELYWSNLKNCREWYPAWLSEAADIRLIALGMLPQSVYERYKLEVRTCRKEWEKINRAAKREAEKQNIPEEITTGLQLHDAALLSLRKSHKNYVMTVAKCGTWQDDSIPYRKVIFHDAVVVEKEAGLRPRKRRASERNPYGSNVAFLYFEVYRMAEGLEVHMMFDTPKGLAYLTVACSRVSFEDTNSL